MPKPKPAYREIERWSPSNHGRGGAKVTNFFLHTQEGDGTAESLAGYLQNPANQVSYHYTVDNGGTVCDIVDTDLCSWSVLDANPISINLCFAGSRAAWSRQQWLDRMGRAIEIAAYLAVQDCRKYGIPPHVIAPPYRRGPGISDHRYVTRVLGMGTHTDVGDGFPWDVFAQHVRDFTTDHLEEDTPMSAAEVQDIKDYVAAFCGPIGSDVKDIREQHAGQGARNDTDGYPGWPQLGGRTIVDALAVIGLHLGIVGFDPKAGQ